MSDDATHLVEELLASQKRFEIYAPKPIARFNMGAAAPPSAEGGPFGYAGATLAVKDDILLSADASVVRQGRGGVFTSSGGEMSAYTSGPVQTFSGSTMTFGAKGQLLLAAGTNGNTPHGIATDHDALYLQPSNGIALHYRIDSLQNNLFEFLHGRLDHEPNKFDREKKKAPLLTKADLQGGYVKNLHRSLAELYPTKKQADVFYPSVLAGRPEVNPSSPEPEDPVRWIDPLFREDRWDSRKDAVKGYPYLLFGSDEIDELEYGFSEYLAMYDPYRVWNPDGFSSTLIKRALKFLSVSVAIRRMRDILNLFLFDAKSLVGKASKGLAGLAGVIGGLAGLDTALLGLVHNPPLPLLPASPLAPGGSKAAAKSKAVQEEPPPGSEERMAAAYASPLPPFPENEAPARHAQVTSGATTYDLSAQSTWTMTVETDVGVETVTLDLGAMPATPAQLTLDVLATAADGSAPQPQGPVDVVLAVNGVRQSMTLGVADLQDPAAIAAAIEAAHGGRLEPVQVVGDATPQQGSGGSTETGANATLQNASNDVSVSAHAATQSARGPGEQLAHLILTTKRKGASASIVVYRVDGDGDGADPGAPDVLRFEQGDRGDGRPAVAAVADPSKMTIAEIAARIGSHPHYDVTPTAGGLRIESPTEGNGSRVHVEGDLADALYGGPRTDVVHGDPNEDPFKPDNVFAVLRSIQYFSSWVAALPDHFKQYLKPHLAKVEKAAATFEKQGATMLKAAKRQSGSKAAAGRVLLPPENIGLVASQGISLATHDRILGVGGHGVLFVVDGNSAGPDKQKHQQHAKPSMVALKPPLKETHMTNLVAKNQSRTTREASLGFRVLSDTTVDLSATQSAQLFAAGRGQATAARPDGKQAVGIGVARVLGSRAAEVAGYEKVVISARSGGDQADAEGKSGGRVELAGQTIAIGGMNLADTDVDGAEIGPNDFLAAGDAEHWHLGIAPFDLDEVAVLEHILKLPAPKPSMKAKAQAAVSGATAAATPLPQSDHPGEDHLDMSMYCWPEKLRKEHPQTQRVYQHALKESVSLAGPYMIGAVADKGVMLGRRKASEDPFVNELDPKSPRLEILEQEVTVTLPNADEDGAMLSLSKDMATMAVGTDPEGGLAMTAGTVTVKGGDTTLTVDESAGVEVDAPKVTVSSQGQIKIKGQTVYIN